jgi:hypothetical protein
MNILRAFRNSMTISNPQNPVETILPGLLMIFTILVISMTVCEAGVDDSHNSHHSSLAAEDDLKSGGLSGKALLSFKTEKHLVPLKSFKLFRSDLNTSQQELIQRGWTTSGETLVWTPGGTDPYMEIPIRREESQGDSSITTFNYMQFDYQELYPDNPSKLFFEMILDSEDLDEDLLVAGGYKVLHDLEVEESQDITITNLTRKDYWYLVKRVTGLPYDKNWVFAQSEKSAVFQRRFYKDLQSIESMELFFSRAIDISQVKLTLRVGWGGLLKKEEIVYWDDISVKELHMIKGRQFLKIGLGELIRHRYSNKKNVTLKEVVVFIPGDSGQLAQTHPVENILFQKAKKSYRKEDWQLAALTHNLPQGRKRFELNLFGMVNATGNHPNIKSMRLFISPQNKHTYSGVRFQGARVNQMVHIQRLKFLLTGEQLNQRWGGPFLTHTADPKNVEWVQIKSYFPFQNIDSKDQYKSGLDRLGDVTIRSDKGALYRFVKTQGLLAADLQFYSKDASFSMEFPSFYSKTKNREITVEWELEGALKLQLMKRFLHPLKGNITQYHLKKGETPFLKIELVDKSLLEKIGRVSGRIVIKSIKVRDLLENEFPQEDGRGGLFSEIPTSEKLKEEEKLSIYETEHVPHQQFDNSAQSTIQLVKSGVVIQAQNPINQWRSNSGKLMIQGEGQWVDIDWPVQTSLDKDTLFFLGVSKGAESILSVEIVPTSQGQKLPPIFSIANNSVRLVPNTTDIESLQIRMKLSGGPYKISIEEMSLFQPIVLSQDKAFNLPNLLWGETPLTPKNTLFDSKTKALIDPGSLKAIVSSKNSDRPKLSWTTEVNRKSAWIRGLRINYQVPIALHNNNPCWLYLTLVGSKSKTDQNVCFDRANGQVFLPSEFLFQNFGINSNESLNSIHWSIRLSPRKHMEKIPLAINLEMALDGVDIQTIHDDLKRQPVFEWNMEKVYPSLPDNQLYERLFDNKGWTDFRMFNLAWNSSKSLPILNLDHPYLQTKTIAFEGRGSLFSKEEDIEEDSDGSTWGQLASTLLKVFMVLFLLWLAFNQTFHKKLKIILKNTWKLIVQKTLRPKIFLNRAIGLIGIGPGLWAIGRFAGPEVESIWYCTLLVLLTGVFYHELRWFLLENSTSHNWVQSIFSGDAREIPFFVYFVSMMVFGWSAWQLGQFSFVSHPAMLLIPLAFLSYFYIPWLPDRFHRAIYLIPQSRKYSATNMLGLATALYIFGSLWDWSEIFMSLGGIVLVLLWRNLMQRNQTKFELYWPKVARPVYAETGNKYLAGFLVTMGIGAFCLLVGLDTVAEHTVNISFFMFVTALCLNAWGQNEPQPGPMHGHSPTLNEDNINHA